MRTPHDGTVLQNATGDGGGDESALGGCIVKDDVARGDFVPDAVYGGPQTVDMLGMVGVTTRPEAVAKDQ